MDGDGNDLITSKDLLLHYLLESSERHQILFVCRTHVLWILAQQLCPFRGFCVGLVAFILAILQISLAVSSPYIYDTV